MNKHLVVNVFNVLSGYNTSIKLKQNRIFISFIDPPPPLNNNAL